jgi:peroxiredoxin
VVRDDLQVKPGDKVPDVTIDFGFNVRTSLPRPAPSPASVSLASNSEVFARQPITPVNLAERCAKGKRILLGLPGAFTPC